MSEYLSLPPGQAYFNPQDAGQQSSQTAVYQGLAYADNPTTVYEVPDPTSRPHASIEVNRLYLPIAITTGSQSAGDTPPPSTVIVQLYLIDAARIFWAWAESIPLIADTTVAGFSSATFTVSADLVNPIEIAETDSPSLSATLTFDQATTGVGARLAIASQLVDPQTTSYAVTPAFGTAYYTIPTKES